MAPEPLAGCDLKGTGVLVTRPAHQAGELCRLVEEHGGRALRFPCIEIGPPDNPAALASLLAGIDSFDLAVFISPNSVARLAERLPVARWPERLQLAAVGQGTARALQALGRPVTLVPDARFDSEALLAIPRLADMAGARVVIFRGEGGRPLLGDTLRQRGAEVHYAALYRRRLPAVDADAQLARWDEVDLVSVTSGETLQNLLTLLGDSGRERLVQTPLLVVAERTRDEALKCGFTEVVVAPRADPVAIVATLCSWVGTAVPRN